MGDVQQPTKLIRLPLATKPKARPNINFSQGIVYMPPDYEEWRAAMVNELRIKGLTRASTLTDPLRLVCRFGRDFTDFQLYETELPRPTGVRGDLDNLLGGFMEVLQDAGVIGNDGQIVHTDSRLWTREEQ